jgi:hypothetical protein
VTRDVLLQAGAYAEHRFVKVRWNETAETINAPTLRVRLAPGAGQRLEIAIQRFVNQPTLRFPWDR